MNMFGGNTISSYLFLGFLLVLCKAQNGKEDVFQCYDCNSKFDPRCGDPFDSYTIGIVNCSRKKFPEHLIHEQPDPLLCRKTVQKTQGETRVIRGCGYIKDPHDDKKCFRRTGTSAIEVFYCSCTTSLCNASEPIHRPLVRVILLALVLKLAITSLLNGLP